MADNALVLPPHQVPVVDPSRLCTVTWRASLQNALNNLQAQITALAALEGDTTALTEALAALQAEVDAAEASIAAHIADTGNPHSTTAAQVGADPVGTAAAAIVAHVALADPHTQYLTEAAATAGYQPLDPTLTALAGLDASAGLVEQTGPDAFTKRAIGVASATDVLTRADGDGRYDAAGAADAAYVAATDFTALAIDAITPETIGMAPGYDQTVSNRITNLDTVFGSPPMFFSAASTATGLPVALSGQGVFIPFSSTAGMMFYTSASATDTNRRVFYRQGSGSAWGAWIELGFRYWNAVSAASGSFTPNLDLNDAVIRTALTVNPTISNPTGTKQNGRELAIRLRDNGTPRTITWGSEYRSMTATLPATTTANKTLYCFFRVNADESTLDLIGLAVQP